MTSTPSALRRLIAPLLCVLSACDAGSVATAPSTTVSPPPPEPYSASSEALQSTASNVFARGGSHLLVTLELSETGAEMTAAQRVAAPLPRQRKQPGAHWLVEVLDATGKAIFTTAVAPAHSEHGEFADHEGNLERVEVVNAVQVVPVRLPLFGDADSIRVIAGLDTLPAADRRRGWPRADRHEDLVLLGTLDYPAEAP